MKRFWLAIILVSIASFMLGCRLFKSLSKEPEIGAEYTCAWNEQEGRFLCTREEPDGG